jgi:hypothetical protein
MAQGSQEKTINGFFPSAAVTRVPCAVCRSARARDSDYRTVYFGARYER